MQGKETLALVFATLFIIIIIVLGLLFIQSFNTTTPIVQDDDDNKACTLDAKLCPDGTYVGRDSTNNCQFYNCPIVSLPVSDPISERVENVQAEFNADGTRIENSSKLDLGMY